jgi:putative acetyltransferase
MQITVRTIEQKDNAALAKIIRQVMEEFNVNLPNTVYTDPTTDHLFELFQRAKAVYNVAEVDGKVVGGGGIYPTRDLPDGVCELVKMWLLPEARGLGLGRSMVEKCLQQAKELGFTKVYLESMPELKTALNVYEKFGFQYLSEQMGNSGHTGCQKWMIKIL